MNWKPLTSLASLFQLAIALYFVESWTVGAQAGILPLPIPPDQAQTAPALYTGMLGGGDDGEVFIGSGTLIRRHTALTAGHVLYNAKDGFATNVHFLPRGTGAAAPKPHPSLRGLTVGVLGGYQQEVVPNLDRPTRPFEFDLGRLVLLDPAPGNAWADWAATPDALTDSSSHFLFFGWHYDPGLQDVVLVRAESDSAHRPYTPLETPHVFFSDNYFSFPGTSGGPVYARRPLTGNRLIVVAEHIFGLGLDIIPADSTPNSGCRAIDATARRLLIDGEYEAGLIVSGKLKAPVYVRAGNSFVVKTGVYYKDGYFVNKRYDELSLAAGNSAGVSITKAANNRFLVRLDPRMPSRTKFKLRLRRDTGASRAVFAKLVVTVL